MITHNQPMQLHGVELQMLAGARVLVAVSGGADSTALALTLGEVTRADSASMSLVGLVHINHQLRGDDSDADEGFCRALADRLGVPILVVVAPVVVAAGRSPESAARRLRYQAFAEAASLLGATCVVTAHTMDDQVETVLLRLLRGAGLRGVSGIRARRGLVVRPMLRCRRSDVRAWLTARGESWREDQSNDDVSIARNHVRHRLLPVLEGLSRDVAPGGLAAIARFAHVAADDEDALTQTANLAGARVVTSNTPEWIELDRAGLAALPVAVARRVLRRQVDRVVPGADWSLVHIDEVLALGARGGGGGSLSLPGVLVERIGSRLRLSPAADRRAEPVGRFEYRLDVPGVVRVPEAGLELAATRLPEGTEPEVDDVLLPAPEDTLIVRNRRAGDRVRTGSGHHRKVQDLMVDAKIPRFDRDRVPLVVARDGQILWGAGLPVPRRVGWEGPPTGMVVLKVRKLETT